MMIVNRLETRARHNEQTFEYNRHVPAGERLSTEGRKNKLSRVIFFNGGTTLR